VAFLLGLVKIFAASSNSMSSPKYMKAVKFETRAACASNLDGFRHRIEPLLAELRICGARRILTLPLTLEVFTDN